MVFQSSYSIGRGPHTRTVKFKLQVLGLREGHAVCLSLRVALTCIGLWVGDYKDWTRDGNVTSEAAGLYRSHDGHVKQA